MSSMPPPVGWSSPTSCPPFSPEPRSLPNRALHLRGGPQGAMRRCVGGLPPVEFLETLDPRLAAVRARVCDRALPPGTPAGHLCREWATFDLPEGIPIAMGAFDAHYAAVGAGVRPGTLVKIIGTSTCDCAVLPMTGNERDDVPRIPGICGIVPGSIMPGFFGIEAGQSAVGDLLNWWVDAVCEGDSALHTRLSAEATALHAGESGLIALDWNNGNRTILVDARLTGLIVGQTLHTTRAEIYRALIEATAFGARAIIDRIRERRGHRSGRLLRRHRREERPLHADLRRRARPADADCRLGADAGARGGDLRRGHGWLRRRRLRRLGPRSALDDHSQGPHASTRPLPRMTSTIGSTSSIVRSTTRLAASRRSRQGSTA